MNINFNPSFLGSIIVEDEKGTAFFEKEVYSEKEIEEFIQANSESVPYHSILKSCFIPIRTDSWALFAKDLFLPTLVNRALKIDPHPVVYGKKVDNTALRIISSCFAIILDLGTLLPRLVATPFRVAYNNVINKKSDHPLLKLIKQNAHSAEVEKIGLLKIKIDFHQTIIEKQFPSDTDLNLALEKTGKGICVVSIDGFQEIDQQSESYRNLKIDIDRYLKKDDKWKKIPSLIHKGQMLIEEPFKISSFH